MLIRSSSKTIRIAECATKTIDTIKNTKVIRYVDDLAFTAKHAVEFLGAKTCNWIQTSLYNVKKTVKNLDARLNSCYMEAFDRLPENVKIFLKDNCGMIDLDASISRTVSQCQDASGTVLKSADEIAEVLEREIKGSKLPLSGQWIDVNESMSEFSRKYQTQITGQEGKVWYQNGVKFDGMKEGILLDAKGKYAQFVNKNTGEFYNWFTGSEDLVNEAWRQIYASEGARIQWYFAEESSMNAVKVLFENEGVEGIELIFEAMK